MVHSRCDNLTALAPARSPFVGICTVALVVICAYLPGLNGGFLFDDYANLPALGRYGPVQDWDALLRYLTSGIADPTGRPISMLSFLIDARDWPAEPFPFKRTNLILHLCNGMLLYSVLAALGRRLGIASRDAGKAALLASAVWLLHPLWTSTVLYVVQRHAILATFFVLAGLRTWIAGVTAFEEGKVRRGWLLSILAVPVFGLLAGLSKSNGFLLPLLLLALQPSVLRRSLHPRPIAADDRHGRVARMLFAWLPASLLVLVISLLTLQGVRADEIGLVRPWSVAERLLTQPRALFDYLHRLFVPGIDATGVFADGFSVSTSWRSPWTTTPAVLGLLILATAAWMARRRFPSFSAAAMFFLAAHLMESSVIPLELYFEHRNYLPATLLFWPFALLLTRDGRYRQLCTIGALGFVLVCALATLVQARLWGDPAALAYHWARALPNSPRAQTYAAAREIADGQAQQARRRLKPLLARSPGEVQYALTFLHASCAEGPVRRESIDLAASALRPAGITLDMSYQWLARTLSSDRTAACSGLPDAVLAALLEAGTSVVDAGSKPEHRSRNARLQALWALRQDRCSDALTAFNRRLDFQRRPEFAHEQVGLLATYCSPTTALSHLDYYLDRAADGDAPLSSPALRLRDRIMARQGYWTAEWRRLRTVLTEESQEPDQAPAYSR